MGSSDEMMWEVTDRSGKERHERTRTGNMHERVVCLNSSMARYMMPREKL
jgi:hypothetical protein